MLHDPLVKAAYPKIKKLWGVPCCLEAEALRTLIYKKLKELGVYLDVQAYLQEVGWEEFSYTGTAPDCTTVKFWLRLRRRIRANS